jgi:hypothetical protein
VWGFTELLVDSGEPGILTMYRNYAAELEARRAAG